MELHVSTTVEVSRPVEAVWAYVVDGFFDHHGRWDPAVAGMERLTDGPLRVGTRGLETRSFGGKQTAEFEVTQLDRPQLFGFRNITGPFALERQYRFAGAEGGTTVDFVFDMVPRGAMRLLFPLIRPIIARQVRANIGRIPGLVPGATAAGAEQK
jgi:Polyketide cyclase / dehydrase and lipid transport